MPTLTAPPYGRFHLGDGSRYYHQLSAFIHSPKPGLPDHFTYSSLVNFGNDRADSYIYKKRGSAGYSIPFTQVFLRPKLTQRDLNFSQIGSDSAASNRCDLPNSYTIPVRSRTS